MSQDPTDRIHASWLEEQRREGNELARSSDILDLSPVAGEPPYKYIAEFACRGLVRSAGEIGIADRHAVGIFFPEHYQRKRCNPAEILTWLGPSNEWHPNISSPFVCVGPVPVGMSLVNLLSQLFQIICWQRFTPKEDDALNADACSWARQNLDRFPVDPRRSLRRAEARSDG